MKKLLYLFNTVNKNIRFCFLVSIGLVLLIELVLNNHDELFSGGHKIGQIVSTILMSFATSFIFYFIVVHSKEQKDKDKLRYYSTKKIDVIISDCVTFIEETSKKAEITLMGKYPTSEELDEICKNLNPNSDAPICIGPWAIRRTGNWMDYFSFLKSRSLEKIKEILLMPQMETELFILVVDIQDCIYFKLIDTLVNTMPSNTLSLTPLKSNITIYIDLVKKLEEYSLNQNNEFQRYNSNNNPNFMN
jgi:hypothetical protein